MDQSRKAPKAKVEIVSPIVSPKFLLLEDNMDDAHLISLELQRAGIVHTWSCAATRDQFVRELETFEPDVVLADYNLTDIDGSEALQIVQASRPELPFILVTGALGEEKAVEMLRHGVTDYILKDSLFALAPALKRVLRELEQLRQKRHTDALLELRNNQLEAQNRVLVASEERFRQLAENIREVFWMTDAQKNRMLYISPGYGSIWGRTCESLYDSPCGWVDAIHPEDRARISKALVKQRLGLYDETYRILHPDGSVRWIHDRAFPIKNEAGEVYRIAGIAEDVTQRTISERHIALRNAVIRALVESDSILEASEKILGLLCQALGCSSGGLWSVARESHSLTCVYAWTSLVGQNSGRSSPCLKKGEELAGRVWQSGQLEWVTGNGTASRGLGFPIYLNTQVTAVMEFWGLDARPQDTQFLETLTALTGHIGQFIGRKTAESAVRESEARKSGIMEAALDSIITIDHLGAIVEFNSAAEKTFGCPRTGALGKRMAAVIIPGYLRNWFEQGLAGGFTETGPVLGSRSEIQILRADGTEFPAELTMTRVEREGLPLFTAFIRDISRRKQSEAELATLAHAVESTSEPICITDLEDRLVFVNRAFETKYGYTKQEVLGKTPEVLFSPKNRAGLMQEILARTRQGGWRGEVTDRKKDGTEFLIALSTSQIRDAKGKIIGLMGVAQDISERKRAEQEIRLLAHAVQSTHELVSLTDENNKFIFVNRAFVEAYGYPEAEVLGRTPDFLYSLNNPPLLCKEIFEQTLLGGWRGEVLNIKKDGTELPISLSTARICSSDGSLLGLIGVARNIAERKRLEREGSALSRLNYRLNAATTPLMAATIILEIAWDLFHWDAAYVHLYSASNDKILPVLTVDTINDSRTPVATNTFTHDPSPLMRMVMQQGARVINRGTNDPNICTVPFGDTARPSASMMYVPIHLGEQVIGILSVQSYKTQAFGGTDLKLLQTLADNCGDALARIKAAEALREAESKYRSIFEHATEGIFQTTVAGQYLNVNPALARMFGYASPAEMVASIGNIERETFASPENAAELRHLLAETESVMGFESERFRKDRSRIWTNINVRVSRGSDRQVLYFEGTVQDITKRKEAERILRESERNLRLIAENTEDAIFAFNMDREPLYINSAVEALTGYTFGDIQERGFVNWIHPDDEKRMLTLWEDLYKGAGHSEVEFRLITKNGEMKWCSSTWGPLFDEAGKQIGVQGRERDISERKELEQQLLESTTDERRRVGHELHDGLGQFLAGVSFKAKALEQTLLANKSTHWAEASELVSLVSQAIKQTRTIARGLDPVDIETIGLPAALQNLSAETETMFNTACGFACSDATLPALKPEVALSLYRMAQEAIHNAVVHGNSRRIGITLSMTPSDVLLCVKDDGTGFNAEDMKARGMGLRVMQYRARSVGAILEVSSKPGAGTEIRCGLGRSAAFA